MAMKLPTRPTQGPIRGLPFTTGSRPRAAFLILARPLGDKVSPERSGTTLERSRMCPSASMMPGFSRPGAPKRTSFMDQISSLRIFRVGLLERGDWMWIMRPGRAVHKRPSECAGERAAVDQQVLPGDVAGLGRAQEHAGGAELVRRAEALGRNGSGARGAELLVGNALLLGGGLDVALQSVGVEGARQQEVDGHVGPGDRARDAGHEGGKPGPRRRREIETDQRHLHRARRDIYDAA